MKQPKIRTMYHKGTIRAIERKNLMQNKKGRRVFGEKADEYMKEYSSKLAFNPRG